MASIITDVSDLGLKEPAVWQDSGRLYREDKYMESPATYKFIDDDKAVLIHDFRDDAFYILPFEEDWTPSKVSVKEETKPYKYEYNVELNDQQKALLLKLTNRYNSLSPAGKEHRYLRKKGIEVEHNVHQSGDKLIIPLYNVETGEVLNYQTITSAGEKRFMKGMKAKGLVYSADFSWLESKTIWLCEGVATYYTIRKYIDVPGLACMSKANMIYLSFVLQIKGYTVKCFKDREDPEEHNRLLPPVFKKGADWNDAEVVLDEELMKKSINYIFRMSPLGWY